MGNEGKPEEGKGKENPSGNPNPDPNPTPDPAEELRRKNEELEAQLREKEEQIGQKDQYITGLSTEKATLEERLKHVGTDSDDDVNPDTERKITDILENASVDPQGAAKKLAKLMSNVATGAEKNAINKVMNNLGGVIETTSYVNKVKSENPELMDLGLEPVITSEVNELIKRGQNFKTAVDNTIKKYKEKVNKFKPANSPQEPPSGARGEDGGNPPPTPPPPPKEITAQDEVKERQTAYGRTGLM